MIWIGYVLLMPMAARSHVLIGYVLLIPMAAHIFVPIFFKLQLTSVFEVSGVSTPSLTGAILNLEDHATYGGATTYFANFHKENMKLKRKRSMGLVVRCPGWGWGIHSFTLICDTFVLLLI